MSTDAGRTVVYQSFRTSNVPAWMTACMESAKQWAQASGFEYRFYDDQFFGFCPPWYREQVSNHILLMSDLARLVAGKALLDEGFERVIWVDADLLIFAPSAFKVHADTPFAFCRELWVGWENGKFVGWPRVNNAVCTFARGNSFLDFYIDAAQRIVRQALKLDPLSIGTTFLTGLHALMPIPQIQSVGTFNPILMDYLAQGRLEPLSEYRTKFANPIAAANLCGSFSGKTVQGVLMSEAIYAGAVSQLLGDPGRTISGK